MIELSNKSIILSRLRQADGSALIRLYNPTDEPAHTALKIHGDSFEIGFNAFEVKTFVYKNARLSETDMIV